MSEINKVTLSDCYYTNLGATCDVIYGRIIAGSHPHQSSNKEIPINVNAIEAVKKNGKNFILCTEDCEYELAFISDLLMKENKSYMLNLLENCSQLGKSPKSLLGSRSGYYKL